MSAYRTGQVWSWASAILWFGVGAAALTFLALPHAAAVMVILMLGITWVTYDRMLCPRCARSIFSDGRRAWSRIGGPFKTCTQCNLDLTQARSRDRRFKEGN